MSPYDPYDVHSPWAGLLRELRTLEHLGATGYPVDPCLWRETAGRLQELAHRFAAGSLQHDRDIGRLLIAIINLPITTAPDNLGAEPWQ
jgi:hypothetical protein